MTLKAELMNKYSKKWSQDSIFSQHMIPYQVDDADINTAYIRFESDSGEVFIIRISVSGTVTTVEYAYDTWANRTTASYTGIND